MPIVRILYIYSGWMETFFFWGSFPFSFPSIPKTLDWNSYIYISAKFQYKNQIYTLLYRIFFFFYHYHYQFFSFCLNNNYSRTIAKKMDLWINEKWNSEHFEEFFSLCFFFFFRKWNKKNNRKNNNKTQTHST